MPGKHPQRALRAVVSEIEDSFVISILTVSDEDEIELVTEKIVESLGLAGTMIEQTVAKLKRRIEGVGLICNSSNITLTKLPKSRPPHE